VALPRVMQPWKMWLIFYKDGSNCERQCTETELCEMLKAAHDDMIMSRMQAFRWFKRFRNRREYTSNV